MTTFNFRLEQINAASLQELLSNGVRESRQLDYKERLPGNQDEERREFLSDITSFANAIGGDIIYGMKERRDAENKLTGEPESILGLSSLNLNAVQLMLDNLIRDGVDPRMPLINYHEIPRDPGPPCLLIRVPRSWAGLHMVTFKNLSRFYSRNSSGKYQLDVREIRSGFLLAETAQDRLRRFRADRIASVLAGETPIPMGSGPKIIFHALPFLPSDIWNRFLGLSEVQIVQWLAPVAGHPSSWRFNLDGFVTHTMRGDPSRDAYAQMFRDGGIETVTNGLIGLDGSRGGFHGKPIEGRLIGRFKGFQVFWDLLGVSAPFLIGLTLTGVAGQRLFTINPLQEANGSFDRDIIVIPDVLIEDISEKPEKMLRPVFDLMWNAAGWSRSPSFRNDEFET